MKRVFKTSVLNLTLPYGQTLAITLVMIVGILGVLEGLSRFPPVQSILYPQRIGNHPSLALRLDLLDRRVSLDGSVDCIFIGSSLVHSGIDPQIVSASYERKSGKSIRCFNFGIQSLNAVGAQKLGAILLRKYHPRILIYGSSFRDFIPGYGFSMDSAWARYALGKPSLPGWLEYYSYAYRYYLTYTTFPDKVVLSADNQNPKELSDDYGYGFSTRSIDVSRPPDPQEFARQYRISAKFSVSKQSLAAFQALAQLQDTDVRIVVVDMPMAPNGIYFLPGGERDYQDYSSKLSAVAEQNDVAFWHPGADVGIPETGWGDYIHMNREGAKVFSEWLGAMLAETELVQTQASPSR